jgi:peptidoglycan/xylan/chitin deacetylase (PgdA/CDA1 family)
VAGLALAGGGAVGLAAGGGWVAAGALGAGALLAQGFMLDTRPTKIPVVMLHSVVGELPRRPPTFDVWCPPDCFEGYLRYLARRGFRTITLRELHDHLRHGSPIPERPIVLTFDDGYLDNWVYAAPLLRKYGFTGTIFMPSDFVQPGRELRPTIEDAWAGRVREDELDAYGYVNEAELRALADSGTMDIQSHGATHTWLPVSERVIDFHHPGLRTRHLRWMWWNRFPERKPFWFREITHDDLPWGAPVYENRLALSSPAVAPDPGLEEHLVAQVARLGGRELFSAPDWRTRLAAEVERYRADHPPVAEPEDDAAFRERLRGELRGSRERLEALTGGEVRFMCWPNGGTCPAAFELLEETGYLAATLPSRARQPRNHAGTRPDRIGRISATSFFRGSRRPGPWVFSFALKLERNRGNLYAELPIKAIWLWRRVVRAPGARPHGAD